MASPSVASRNRRPAVDTDDAVIARAIQFSEWAKRNAKAVIGVGAVALVAVAAFLWYRYDSRQSAERAAIAYAQVEQTVLSGNATLAQRDLPEFIRRHDGTVEADQARMLLAKVHLEAGKPTEAVAVLQEVKAGMSTPVGAQASLLLAAAQGEAGEREASVATYLRVADAAELDYQRDAALAEAALLRQQGGDFAGAAELYRRLVEAAPEGSFERSVYEMRLAEAEGQALGR